MVLSGILDATAGCSTPSEMDTIREHIYTPQTIIERLFNQHRAESSDAESKDSLAFGKAVQDHFRSVFGDKQSIDKIPVLDQTGSLSKPKVGTLVRFRCMVQDPSYGEELHLSVAQLINPATGEIKQRYSQYTDAGQVLDQDWEVDYTSPDNIFVEKEVAYCVSVPGESEWAQIGRSGRLETMLETMNISDDSNSKPSAGSARKFPLDGQSHSAALVKFYAPSSVPRVSSVVDIVGIYELGYNPREEHGEEAADASGGAEWPCLHSIFHVPVSLDSIAPDLPAITVGEHMDRRSMCLDYLTTVLGGDDLAAHYLLLHLLSNTVDVQGVKVGKLSLNLIGFPGAKKETEASGGFALTNLASKMVGDALAQLVSRCVEIPFELKLLNNSSFLPNAESGDLHSGVLQLAHSTQIVCDETCLREGTLNERGVRNLQSLQTVILDQSVTYLYPFQPIEMGTNLRILVLSIGKSILQNDCDMYLSEPAVQFLADISNESVAGVKPLDPMHTEQIRQYLEHARNLDFSVPKDMSDRISEEYADMRRTAHESKEKMISQTELAQTVTVARLLSVSKGESELSWESWKEARALETRRVERNDHFAAKKAQGSSQAAPAI
ncbi:hypothetical protein GGI15_003438 [Coemansia interrupta]|uniref:Mini-chromosome maintenance complex-binding protein n=1 Tax=Coemansia interrupta TaxID=1126814 RepID=A0A9W8HAT0_9FUNG|nr:hypothetical protein GGI15_003438 [Coemansia interrupta]